jgi:hypothetical protein
MESWNAATGIRAGSKSSDRVPTAIENRKVPVREGFGGAKSGLTEFSAVRAYNPYPGRAMCIGERPAAALLAFVAEQIDVLPDSIFGPRNCFAARTTGPNWNHCRASAIDAFASCFRRNCVNYFLTSHKYTTSTACLKVQPLLNLPSSPVRFLRNLRSRAWLTFAPGKAGNVSVARSLPLRANLVTALACIAMLGLTVGIEWRARDSQVRETEAYLVNLASSLSQDAEDTIDISDTALTGTLTRLETDGTSPEVLALLNRKLAAQIALTTRIKDIIVLVPSVIDSAVKSRIDALAMTEPIRDKETDRQEVHCQVER